MLSRQWWKPKTKYREQRERRKQYFSPYQRDFVMHGIVNIRRICQNRVLGSDNVLVTLEMTVVKQITAPKKKPPRHDAMHRKSVSSSSIQVPAFLFYYPTIALYMSTSELNIQHCIWSMIIFFNLLEASRFVNHLFCSKLIFQVVRGQRPETSNQNLIILRRFHHDNNNNLQTTSMMYTHTSLTLCMGP